MTGVRIPKKSKAKTAVQNSDCAPQHLHVVRRKAGKLFIYRGKIVQLEYDSDGLVEKMTVVRPGVNELSATGQWVRLRGVTVETIFDPAVPEDVLPE
jgi:hypothetical protein